MRNVKRNGLLIGLSALFGAALAAPLYAATMHVAAGEVAISGNGACSLREAIENANANATTHADCPPAGAYGADTIELAASTYSLTDGPFAANGTNGLPSVPGTLTVNGQNATIERAPGSPSFRLFHVTSPGNLTLNSLTVRNGDASGIGLAADGGGILNLLGTLTLNSVTLTGNAAFGSGGGLRTTGAGVTTITNSTIGPNNSAASGGGIFNGEPHQLVVSGSLILDNNAVGDGGGLSNFATAELSCTTVSDNEASFGGGIYEATTATLLLTNSSVLSNRATDGSGGGIYNGGKSNFNAVGTQGLVVANSTIAQNSALESGGGIFNTSANVFLSNTTIAGNTADSTNTGVGDGGGFAQEGSGFNAGGPIITFPAQLVFRNTIIADNIDRTGESPDCIDTQSDNPFLMTDLVNSHGYNLIEDPTGCSITEAANPGTDVTQQDPNLGPLLSPASQCSPTICPVPLSPAIEGGNPNGCTGQDGQPLTTDQRGVSRPLDGDNNGTTICDIGACEFGVVAPKTVPLLAPGGLAVLAFALLAVARRASRE